MSLLMSLSMSLPMSLPVSVPLRAPVSVPLWRSIWGPIRALTLGPVGGFSTLGFASSTARARLRCTRSDEIQPNSADRECGIILPEETVFPTAWLGREPSVGLHKLRASASPGWKNSRPWLRRPLFDVLAADLDGDDHRALLPAVCDRSRGCRDLPISTNPFSGWRAAGARARLSLCSPRLVVWLLPSSRMRCRPSHRAGGLVVTSRIASSQMHNGLCVPRSRLYRVGNLIAC